MTICMMLGGRHRAPRSRRAAAAREGGWVLPVMRRRALPLSAAPLRPAPRRIAERLFFDKITTGAQDDLQKVTRLAYSLVTTYGMNEKMGNVSYPQTKPGEMAATRPYSEQTAELVDEEVRKLVDGAYARTMALLTDKKELAQRLAQLLLEKEVIMKDDVIAVLGPRPFAELNSYAELTTGEKDAPDLSDTAPPSGGGPVPSPSIASVEQPRRL